MRTINAKNRTTLNLGQRGENLATAIKFDASDWLADYPSGTIKLIAQRPGDEYPYPVTLLRSGTVVRWIVSSADSGRDGYGACELQLWDGETLIKSTPWATYIGPALENPEDAPDPLLSYLARIEALVEEAQAAAAAGATPEAVWLKGHAEGTGVVIYAGAEDKPLTELHVWVYPGQQGQPTPGDPKSIRGSTGVELQLTEEDVETGEELSDRLQAFNFLPNGAGTSITCYYGCLDVLSGVLHCKGRLFQPTEYADAETTNYMRCMHFTLPAVCSDPTYLRCNKATAVDIAPTSLSPSENRGFCYIPAGTNDLYLYFRPATMPDTSILDGLTFFIPTDEEQLVQLSPAEYRTHTDRSLAISVTDLTRWSLTVGWRRDITAFINPLDLDNMLLDLQHNTATIRSLLQLLTATETEYLATRNYAVGDLLIVSGVLYRATAAIANGSAITAGVNVARTTFAAEIESAAESGSVTVDSALSDSSENPVQNKVVKAALDGKGTYSKPSGGIPSSDLSSAVQTSLGKADSALQEHQSLSGYATETWVQQQGYLTQPMLAAVEGLMTATRNYASGELLIVGDTLYKATANIASGDTITPGTNVSETTLATEIAAASGGGAPTWHLLGEYDVETLRGESASWNGGITLTNLGGLTDIYIRWTGMGNISSSNSSLGVLKINDVNLDTGNSIPTAKAGSTINGYTHLHYNGLTWELRRASGSIASDNLGWGNLQTIYNEKFNVGPCNSLKLAGPAAAYYPDRGVIKIYGGK